MDGRGGDEDTLGPAMDVPVTRRHLLFYEYVTENVVERRAPQRPGHIALVREWLGDGRLLLAGAVGDPPHGGVLAFAVEDPAEVEDFVRRDPYVESGLVTSWRVEPWNVVS
jgi:uncharacterized protein YciI